MKKVLVCMLAAASMLSGVTAFASGSYDSTNNEVILNDSSKKTVIIAKNTGAKMTDNDVVYVGEAKEGFSAASLLLKANPAPGFYTVMLGGDGSQAEKHKIFIGADAMLEDGVPLAEIENYEETADGGMVTKAYATDAAIDIAQAKTVVVKYGDSQVCEDLDTVTGGDGSIMLAVKLTDIPEAYKDDVRVAISSATITTSELIVE
ncbi:MAG: hypothetical protein PUD92_05085 [Clostridiales bacterium]|nr:hypothetical protein [Clostridiales bacterium]